MRIVLSGASLGIGRYLAKFLVHQGHQVWGMARSIAPLNSLQEELGTQFNYSVCDISSLPQLKEVRHLVAEQWHSIHAVICCAGIQGAIGKAMEVNPALWSETVRINLDGNYYTIYLFHDLLLPWQGRSKILCFSGGGATAPRPHFSAYGVSKAALVRLVETLAQEWQDRALDINAVAPGAIATRMTEEAIAAGPEKAGKEYQQALQTKKSGGASLEKVAALVQYLLSSESDGLSGKIISAAWDPWDQFAQHQKDLQDSDIYTLRRIVPKDRGLGWE